VCIIWSVIGQVNKTGVTHYFSMEKAQRHLGYQPLNRNLDGVVEWYKKRLPQQPNKNNSWSLILNILLMVTFVAILFSFIPIVA